MKVNAPEKLYVHVKKGKVLNVWNSEWVGVNDIEYVRKDAFIEKACEFISLNVADYIDVTHKGGIELLALQERFIDTFKKYMEEDKYD